MNPHEATVIASGFDSTEGPAFDRDGNLFFVNWLSHQILKRAPDGTISEFFNTGGIPAGLAFHSDGSLWVADEGAEIHGLLRITPDAQAEIVVNTYDGQPLNGANDLVFARNGTVYFSDPWGSSAERQIGGFYRYHPDAGIEQIDSGLAFPNGVAIDREEEYVYLAETYTNKILRYPVYSDGSIGPREDWAILPAPFGPDGMAFDIDGVLHVAHYGGSCVERIGPDGVLFDALPIPGEGVTNCAFTPDGQSLIVTCVTTQSVYSVAVAAGGQPLNDGIPLVP